MVADIVLLLLMLLLLLIPLLPPLTTAATAAAGMGGTAAILTSVTLTCYARSILNTSDFQLQHTVWCSSFDRYTGLESLLLGGCISGEYFGWFSPDEEFRRPRRSGNQSRLFSR